jgi:hypothetical protein
MGRNNLNYSLDDSKIEEMIKELKKKIEENYIFPDMAKEVSQFLSNRLKEGLYNGITDPTNLERIISNDMVEASNDLHFYFEYNPSLAEELIQKSQEDKEDSIDDFTEFKSQLKFEQYRNFHIKAAKRLPGNIGYVKLNDFPPAEYAGDVIINALQFLANCNALIFDIRNNGGGYPSMVALIISYFIEPSTKLLNSFYERNKDKHYQSLALPYIPGKRFLDKPLYILTSRRTASAAEEFTYNLKMMERATIVGEITRGAANTPDLFPIYKKFVIWLPVGRPINPISKDNWEGKGVSPHIKVPQEIALEKAHMLAFQHLLNKEFDEAIKRMLKFEFEYCQTHYHPIKIALKSIQDCQGQYERYKILIEDDQFYYERANLKFPLITRDNKTFFADETLKLWFEEENNEKVLVLERRDFPTVLRLFKTKNNSSKE